MVEPGLLGNPTVQGRARSEGPVEVGARINRECTLAESLGEENGEVVLSDGRGRPVV